MLLARHGVSLAGEQRNGVARECLSLALLGPVSTSALRPLIIRFRHFIDGLLALASLDHACRDHRPGVSATLTTTTLDRSSLRWLEISTWLPNSKGPRSSLVQLSAANIRDDALVTHDPNRSFESVDVRSVWIAIRPFARASRLKIWQPRTMPSLPSRDRARTEE